RRNGADRSRGGGGPDPVPPEAYACVPGARRRGFGTAALLQLLPELPKAAHAGRASAVAWRAAQGLLRGRDDSSPRACVAGGRGAAQIADAGLPHDCGPVATGAAPAGAARSA